MARSSRESARTLAAVARGQGGYFTTKQAIEAGYGYPHVEYHESTGAFERVGRGLYRLESVPPGDHDDLVRLCLWSRDRGGVPRADRVPRDRASPPRPVRTPPDPSPPDRAAQVPQARPPRVRPAHGPARPVRGRGARGVPRHRAAAHPAGRGGRGG